MIGVSKKFFTLYTRLLKINCGCFVNPRRWVGGREGIDVGGGAAKYHQPTGSQRCGISELLNELDRDGGKTPEEIGCGRNQLPGLRPCKVEPDSLFRTQVCEVSIRIATGRKDLCVLLRGEW